MLSQILNLQNLQLASQIQVKGSLSSIVPSESGFNPVTSTNSVNIVPSFNLSDSFSRSLINPLTDQE